MMTMVLLAGFSLLLGGILTIAFGIQLELSFGNTLLLAGAIVSCTGIMMLSLWLAVREMKKVARQFGEKVAEPRPANRTFREPETALDKPENEGGPFDLDEAMSRATMSAPRLQEPTSRERSAGEPPSSESAEVTQPAAKPRRNLLFSSSRRKEQERSRAQATEPSLDNPPQGGPPPADSADAPPASFENAGPRSDRARAGYEPPQRRSGRARTSLDEEQPPVTVLKSGVVDGMAYSLFSDGSIEAQMPEGMMRFASIDELRAHLDQRS